MAVGGGQGKTSAENIGRWGQTEQPKAGRWVREDAEQPAGKDPRRQQGQLVWLVQDCQPEKKNAGRVLQLDGVRSLFLRSGTVHGRDWRQHIHQRRVLRAYRTARSVPMHIPDGEVRPEEHTSVGQPGHGHGLYTDHVPAPEWVVLYSIYIIYRNLYLISRVRDIMPYKNSPNTL